MIIANLLLGKCVSGRIVKIGQYLTHLCEKNLVTYFPVHSVVLKDADTYIQIRHLLSSFIIARHHTNPVA